MIELFCPKCGNKHSSANKNCEYCGENLEALILKFKQQHLPIKFQTKSTSIDEKKAKEINKKVSDFVKTEEELNKYDILPENLTPQQPMSSSYSQSVQLQTTGRHPSHSQKIKLQRREESLWIKCCGCCCY